MIRETKSVNLILFVLLLAMSCIAGLSLQAQAPGNGSMVSGTVTDPNGAVIPNAVLTITGAESQFKRTTNSDSSGAFQFKDVPRGQYKVAVSAKGFTSIQQDLAVNSAEVNNVKIPLSVTTATENVDVSGGLGPDQIENTNASQTDLSQQVIERMPTRTPGSGLSDLVTLSAPNVVSDSNGSFHPQGEHADTSYSIDNQPVSDQQSKSFSTQLPPNAVQSVQIIQGATPAEYGDKTTLVVNAVTRSGLNQKKPSGSYSTTYGTFGEVTQDFTLAYGGPKFGNFLAFNFDRSGRFLDAPEFIVLHDIGQSAFGFEALSPRLAPDARLEIPHHHRERVRPGDGADDVVRTFDTPHPIAHGFV